MDNQINDSTPPTGLISNPISGQTVSGTVEITVLAQDDYSIASISFFINGINVSNDVSEPYSHPWDTTSLENGGEHTISASITDGAGHVTILQPVLVTVSN